MQLNPIAKTLIFSGAALIVVGLLWQLGSRFGLGRLPGDIVIERENVRLYFPWVTSIVVSVILSLILYLIRSLGR